MGHSEAPRYKLDVSTANMLEDKQHAENRDHERDPRRRVVRLCQSAAHIGML